MREVEFRLDGDALVHGSARRALSDADWAQFGDWVKQYHELSWLPHNRQKLLDLGRQIRDWLDGPERWLARLLDIPDAPVIAEFAVRARPDEKARRFLEVPWELAADITGHLAEQASVRWAPVRRVGLRADPLPPDDDLRLGVMFMAASPFGESVLDYDTEELAILRATERVGLDLSVEDSGNLDELRIAWEDAKLDALHLSCHGLGGREPFLALEDDSGEQDDVGLDRLANAFTARLPRLLFLSACHTGENDASVDSLALGLVGLGMPAVLAWADAVYDTDASAFAAAFYREAAHRATSIEAAWALAHARLLHPERGRAPPEHWHLARLFLGPRGGGPLAVGRAARLASHPDAGRKDIVEARGGRIEVASRFEFVGRRREIQVIRREFRQPKHAGVLIHGFGRQGKSSLAARIMDRHPELTRVVLFQRCDGPSVLAAIREQVGETAAKICDRWRDRVDPTGPNYDPDALLGALRALFDGPCRYAGSGKPILLLLDDFEALLDPPLGDGHWRVTHDAVAPLGAIIRAFDRGGTDSRLLITSRYQFRLGGERDLASRLLTVPLPETSLANRQKQARQKVLAKGRTGPADLPPLTQRAIDAARGNAGLQDLLFQAVLADSAAGEAAIEALENYLHGGVLPAQEELRDTLEKLVIDKLIEPLSEGERTLLRASTLFQLPLPLSVWKKFAAGADLGRPDRLLAFGLWERLPDIVDPHSDAAGINAIAATRLTALPEEEAERVAAAVLPDLFAAWGGNDRAGNPTATDIELTRLALVCGNLDVLAVTAVYAIRGHRQAFDYRAAAATSTAALDALEAVGRVPEVRLLRAAAEACDYVGDTERLKRIYRHAGTIVHDDPTQPTEARLVRAQFRLQYARYFVKQGQPDAALEALTGALAIFDALGYGRGRAVALGEIARIVYDKGDVEEAVKLNRQALQMFEALRDLREQAVTLGELARIMLQEKENVDEALSLYQQQLKISEALGAPRERALALGGIARIMMETDHPDEALTLCKEAARFFEAAGDRRSLAATMGDIAQAILAKGDVDEALRIHQDQLSIFQALEDEREQAIVLGYIARIMKGKGELDEALQRFQKRQQIFRQLGAWPDWTYALGEVADVYRDKGEFDEALRLQRKRLDMNRKLGDQLAISDNLYDIGVTHVAQVRENGDVNGFRASAEVLTESYKIVWKAGHIGGISAVGQFLAMVLVIEGRVEEARKLLRSSLNRFRKLRRVEEAAQTRELLRIFG